MVRDDNNKNDGGSGATRSGGKKRKGERNKAKAACVKTKTGPIPGLTYKDYQLFLKHFSGIGNSKGTKLVANMAHKEDEEGLQRKNLIGAGRCEEGLYQMKMVQGRRAMETTVKT
nr:hypothetical protein [Tanacetum cinerariifolium]